MDNKMLEIIFVRHAQSMGNIGKDYPAFHRDDPPLTPLGSEQAICLAKRFNHGEISAVYSSTLIRTCQTVQPTAEKLGLDIRVIPELMEVGTQTCGTTLDKISVFAPAAYASSEKVLPKYTGYTLKDETTEHCIERADYVLNYLLDNNESGSVIIVSTHGTFFGYLLRRSLGLSLPEPFSWKVDNCSVTDVIIREGDTPLLVCSNDKTHLFM